MDADNVQNQCGQRCGDAEAARLSIQAGHLLSAAAFRFRLQCRTGEDGDGQDQPSYSQRDPIFNNGLVKPGRQYAETNKQMEAYGLENVRQEVIKQVQAFPITAVSKLTAANTGCLRHQLVAGNL